MFNHCAFLYKQKVAPKTYNAKIDLHIANK
jgi:hypothetical protein